MPPRLLRPKDEPGTSEGADGVPDAKLGKRRAISSACIPCRKRKSKCDGNLPACSTCIAVYRSECYYDADSDHRRKGALKRDIQSLQQQNDALDVIVASLRSLPEDEAIALLHSLRHESNPDVVAASLRNNVRLPPSFAAQTLEADFAQQMSQSNPSSAATETSPWASFRSREHSLDSIQHLSDQSTPTDAPTAWFRTMQDAEFVEHLLDLYFAWVHPFYHFFSREHFHYDMTGGRNEFCSALLVNAVLALACHYSDRPVARMDPGNPASAGDAYFAEAKRQLDIVERSTLTTVQALAIMSVRECSQGRDSSGYQYAGRSVRMALELGLHLSSIETGLRPADAEVRKITFWGVFNVETIFSVAFGRLSQLPRAAADIAKPTIHERQEAQMWRPYEDVNHGLSPSTQQAARPMLFVHQMSKLSGMASDMVNTFYAPAERFTSRRLAAAYEAYQQWHRELPDAFRLENTSLPYVLVMHMYYYACVLHLFRPYIKLDLRGANLYPRDTCTFCANEISVLMNALRAMYGLRRVCLAVTSLLLSASTIHLLNLPSEPASSHLAQGMSDLQAMAVNHVFAGRCVDIIRSLAFKWNIVLPDSVATRSSKRGPGSVAGPSPPVSSFFTTSISPIELPDGLGNKSSTSGSQHSSPFAPQPQQPIYGGGFLDTQGIPNPTQAWTGFWTPFPGQGMPQPQNFNLAGDTSHFDGAHDQRWMMGAHGSHNPMATMDGLKAGMMEEPNGASQWNWQTR